MIPLYTYFDCERAPDAHVLFMHFYFFISPGAWWGALSGQPLLLKCPGETSIAYFCVAWCTTGVLQPKATPTPATCANGCIAAGKILMAVFMYCVLLDFALSLLPSVLYWCLLCNPALCPALPGRPKILHLSVLFLAKRRKPF